jgi:hypothetical protein
MNLNLKSRGAGIRTPTITVQLNICITTFLGELSSRYTDIQLFGCADILNFFVRINMNANQDFNLNQSVHLAFHIHLDQILFFKA